MKIFWVVIFFFVCNPGAAIAAPYELKGYELGMTLSEFKQMFKEREGRDDLSAPYCSDDYNGNGGKILNFKNGVQIPFRSKAFQPEIPGIGVVICSPIERYRIEQHGIHATVWDVDASIYYEFITEGDDSPDKGKLFSIVVTFDKKDFDILRIALTNKYFPDPPFFAMGGVVGWTNEKGIVALMKNIAGSLDAEKIALLTLSHKRLAKLFEARRNKFIAEKALIKM